MFGDLVVFGLQIFCCLSISFRRAGLEEPISTKARNGVKHGVLVNMWNFLESEYSN